MRKGHHHSKIEMELFPFLSVLACTIGTLILLIIVISMQTLSSNPEVTIIARTESAKNIVKKPRYLECTADGIIIYPQQEFVPKNQLTAGNSQLLRLISQVKENKEKEYVILAVRPKGIEVFKQVRELIEKQEIDIGYEPIDEGWQLKITK